LADLLKSFRRSGWVMQSVNLARLTDADRGMFALVEETGGREYREFHRLDEAMGQMLEQTSVSYVLSFQPTALVADGSYHRIEVRLRQPDRGRLTHRDGFLAPREAESAREEDFLVALADRIASEKDGGPFAVAAMAVPFKGTADTALVKTIIEIDGSELFEGASAGLLQLEIETYLVDETLGAVSLSSRRVTLDLAQQGELLKDGGIKVVEDHLLGPGRHRIRVSVVDSGSGRRSVATASVRVPDFRGNEAEVLEPVFPELSRNWLVVRDDKGETESVDSRPLQFGGRNFIPRVEVSLEAGLRVPICILAFDLPQSEPALEIELVAANGGPSIDGHLQLVSDPERTENGLLRLMAQLDTTDLTPGEYEIRVSFGGGRGSTHSRAVRIR
jgi:hypothetical protein